MCTGIRIIRSFVFILKKKSSFYRWKIVVRPPGRSSALESVVKTFTLCVFRRDCELNPFAWDSLFHLWDSWIIPKSWRNLCSVVENVQFYAPKLQIAFSEALFGSIRTDLRLIEALWSLQMDSRHLLDHCLCLCKETSIRINGISCNNPPLATNPPC